MTKPQKFQAKVRLKNQLTANVYYLEFALISPKIIEFLAGQRCLFNVGIKNNNYSLCSSPFNKESIAICVDTFPDGVGSKRVRLLKVGDKIELIGPLGNFILQKNYKKKIFIGTGTGVSPLRSMILDLFNQGFKNDIYLYFGLRKEENIFWNQELNALSQKHTNFYYRLTLSRPTAIWQGRRGYVQEQLTAELLNNNLNKDDMEFYLCGNGKMIADTTNLLEKHGINKTNIFTEKFFEIQKNP